MEPYAINIFLGIENLVFGVVFIALARANIEGRVSPNDSYGLWFKKALESGEYWRQINEAGGRYLLRWGGVVFAIGVVCLFIPPLSETGIWIWFFSMAPMLVLIARWQTYNFSKRL